MKMLGFILQNKFSFALAKNKYIYNATKTHSIYDYRVSWT